MKYCMDASALIGLGERHYPERLKLFSPIWEHVYQGIEGDDIISVDYVKTELEKKADDWRTDFLAKTGKMFLISDEVEKEYAALINEIEMGKEFRVNGSRTRFFQGADPWVIALARNIGDCKVVSAETKSLSGYGIGAICKHIGVEHINLVDFFEENNIGV